MWSIVSISRLYAAAQLSCISVGCVFTTSGMVRTTLPRLSAILQAIKNPQKRPRQPRLLITGAILLLSLHVFQRCGEFTIIVVSDFDTTHNLCLVDLRFNKQTSSVFLALKSSKTDPGCNSASFQK